MQNVVTYETVPVERGSVQAKVTATGNLNAVVDVLVSSQVSGNIKALYADWNSKLKKGQLVALIDPQIFQAQVDQATATFHSAQAAGITAQAQVEKSKSDMSAANAGEKSAEAIAAKDLANETNMKVQWQRADALFGEGIMAQQDYDTQLWLRPRCEQQHYCFACTRRLGRSLCVLRREFRGCKSIACGSTKCIPASESTS